MTDAAKLTCAHDHTETTIGGGVRCADCGLVFRLQRLRCPSSGCYGDQGHDGPHVNCHLEPLAPPERSNAHSDPNVPDRCSEFDSRGGRCLLDLNHATDHYFPGDLDRQVNAPTPAPSEALTREESVDEKLRRRCAEKFDALIEPLRAVAREHGYALAVHGSLKRDIDLIAAPWIEQASAPDVLAAALRDEADRVTGCAFWLDDAETSENANDYTRRNPHPKPHGRLAWSIHLGSGPYIDLSVLAHDAALRAEVEKAWKNCERISGEFEAKAHREKARADKAEAERDRWFGYMETYKAQRDALLKALRVAIRAGACPVQNEHFVCPECGTHVAADEEGGCTECGQEVTIYPCDCISIARKALAVPR